ncbi:MAG: alanine racemase, partial [Chloroflexota bacterium]
AAGAGVRVYPVVKADAYGHGAVPVARAIEAAVDGLSVATFDEAVELRDGGVAAPILVLYPVPAEVVADAARLGIALSVGDEVLLGRLLAATPRSVGSSSPPLRVHVEVETGLGRGGFLPERLPGVVATVRAAPGVSLDGIWSHLQAPGDPTRTSRQGERFDASVETIESEGLTRHLVATGGLVTGAEPAYDAVRPGLATYGIVPDDMGTVAGALVPRLRPVMALRARPVRVADLPAGWGISYGPTFETSRPSRIATLPLGYGDGWSRMLSNRAEALVRGTRVSLVGNVAMDAVMADVTDVPGPPVGVDDEFTLIGTQGGDEISVQDVARVRSTISWEVVTTMSRRLPRVYHAAAGPVGIRTLNGSEEPWRGSTSGTAHPAPRSARS